MKQRFSAKKLLRQSGEGHFVDVRLTIFYRWYGHDVSGLFKPIQIYIFIRGHHVIANFNVDEFEFTSAQYDARDISCDAA